MEAYGARPELLLRHLREGAGAPSGAEATGLPYGCSVGPAPPRPTAPPPHPPHYPTTPRSVSPLNVHLAFGVLPPGLHQREQRGRRAVAAAY